MERPDPIDYWNGKAGERWVAQQAVMDDTLRPLGEAALAAAALAPGLRVLDVGCGCGDTTLALADRVGPTGRVIGIDVSGPMLARARERVGARAIELRQEDAATAALPQVDRVFSRFGVMFFRDPPAAFGNLRAALAPGGRLAFACWRSPTDNPWAKLTMDAAASVLGPPPPADPHAPGPFAFADPVRVRAIVEGAGFRGIEVAPVDAGLRWTRSPHEAELRETFLRVGPAAARLAEAEREPRQRAVEAILAAVRPYLGPTGLVLPGGVWVVTAGVG